MMRSRSVRDGVLPFTRHPSTTAVAFPAGALPAPRTMKPVSTAASNRHTMTMALTTRRSTLRHPVPAGSFPARFLLHPKKPSKNSTAPSAYPSRFPTPSKPYITNGGKKRTTTRIPRIINRKYSKRPASRGYNRSYYTTREAGPSSKRNL